MNDFDILQLRQGPAIRKFEETDQPLLKELAQVFELLNKHSDGFIWTDLENGREPQVRKVDIRNTTRSHLSLGTPVHNSCWISCDYGVIGITPVLKLSQARDLLILQTVIDVYQSSDIYDYTTRLFYFTFKGNMVEGFYDEFRLLNREFKSRQLKVYW